MRGRNSIWLLLALATAVTVLLVYWHFQGRTTAPSRAVEAKGGANHPNQTAERFQSGKSQSNNRIFLARPNQVLATVNGTSITLGDLIPEPGLVSKLTVNAAEIEFELRDAQAFMLQTSLMEQAGATPNVTPDQVEQYYQNHISELGELPADPQARQAAWQEIDIQIRKQLAAQTRDQYNQQLQTFMDNLRTAAQITVTPLP